MKNKTVQIFILFSVVVSTLFTSGYQNAPSLAKAGNVDVCQIFPGNNFWNVPISNLPVHPSSSAWINSIGANDHFHMDFGEGLWAGGPIGIPYNIVSAEEVNEYFFDFYYPDESDIGPYPLPDNPEIEHGGDDHILVVETDECKLYEIYDAALDGSEWTGGSGAIWDLDSNLLRTDTWTSSDAAGLPILPGLARYDEVAAGIIAHALRFTANCSANYYIWPARHKAQHGSCSTPVPFGARFRLKSDYDITGFSPQAQVLLQAFKTYGIVFADNGGDWYVSGAPNESWDNDQLHELDVLTGSDFEAVDTSLLMVDSNSAATNYSTTPHVYSINRSDPNPTALSEVEFTVIFSEPVLGVDLNDFSLTTSGIMGSSISGLAASSSTSYSISVNTGTGDGTLRLDVPASATITDTNGNTIEGLPFETGEVYSVIKSGPIFGDVPISHPYFQDIQILYANGLTAGCSTSPLLFCPETTMDRAQSAVFMLRGNLGNSYVPPDPPYTTPFLDNWSPGTWAQKWAQGMLQEGLSAGCSTTPLMYCPWEQMPRLQAAVFGMRLQEGNAYIPPPATGTVFADITNPNLWYAKWAEQAYLNGLLPACGSSGGKPLFCPNELTSRGLGAYMIVRAKNLSMP